MVVVFDLDDTLYDELTYVQSGFRAVSGYLCETYHVSPQESYQDMLECLAGGRGHIFDDTLVRFSVYSRQAVRRCLSVYRLHKPDIQLHPEAEECLQRLQHVPVYIVTDGNKLVQKNKLVALGLYDRVKFCFITHRYGIKNAKPSPYCFLKICAKEKVAPQEVIYIADNPRKDFVGIKPLGFRTVRIMQGQHRKVEVSPEYDAEYRIDSLAELTETFLEDVANSTIREGCK